MSSSFDKTLKNEDQKKMQALPGEEESWINCRRYNDHGSFISFAEITKCQIIGCENEMTIFVYNSIHPLCGNHDIVKQINFRYINGIPQYACNFHREQIDNQVETLPDPWNHAFTDFKVAGYCCGKVWLVET